MIKEYLKLHYYENDSRVVYLNPNSICAIENVPGNGTRVNTLSGAYYFLYESPEMICKMIEHLYSK